MHLNGKIVLIIVLYQCFAICNSEIEKLKKKKSGYSEGENDCSLSWSTENGAPIIDHENSDFNPGVLQKTGRVIIKINSDFKLSCLDGNFVTPNALQTTKEATVKCKEGNILEYQKQPYKYEEFKCDRYEKQMRPRTITRLERLNELRTRSASKYYASQSPQLSLYYDLVSQPSRTLYIFMKRFEIPFEPHLVDLRKGEQLSPEYTSLNPFKKVPIIDDNEKGFILIESIAILRYFCHTYEIPNQMYPKEALAQARVDEFLEWHHSNIRPNFTQYFRVKVMWPLKTGKFPDPAEVEALEKSVSDSLDILQNFWLKGKPYLTGRRMSIADLVCASEVEQTRMGGFNPLFKRQRLRVWIKRVRAEFGPHYEEAHKIIDEINADYKRLKQLPT